MLYFIVILKVDIIMKSVIQRVASAKVEVEGSVVSEIGPGLLILLGIEPDDSQSTAEALATKIAKLRIFCDVAGKMNLSLLDIAGEALVVSQFTLLADTSHGHRPGFSKAALPQIAEPLYNHYMRYLSKLGVKKVACGIFGAEMKVELVNDGPVTIIL